MHDADQGPGSIRLGALDADFAFEEEPVKLPRLTGIDQKCVGFGGHAIDEVNAIDNGDCADGSFGEDAGARESLGDVAQRDGFDLDGLWTLAHRAFRSKLVSGAKAPLFMRLSWHG
jgi:hypothetical protein